MIYVAVWRSSNALVSYNEVAPRWTRVVVGSMNRRTGKPSRFVASYPDQLSLANTFLGIGVLSTGRVTATAREKTASSA